MPSPTEPATLPPTGIPPGLKTDIVLPVHNRREVTLRCLDILHERGVAAWAGIIVVDDGSTDGTSRAIREHHPEITVLAGDGNLWWTGAIARGMTCALERGAELIFWLNDDCFPRAGTMERLARHAADHQAVAVAQAFTPQGGQYGAFQRAPTGLRRLTARPGEVLACDTFNGNCVCFPRAAVERVGLPDAKRLPHAHGDSDYGLRCTGHGLRVEVLGDALCDNEDNLYLVSRSWLYSPEPMHRIFATFFTPKSNLYVPAHFHLYWRHWRVRGLFLFALPYLKFFFLWAIRLVLPRRWLTAVANSLSATWKRKNFKLV